MEMVRGVAFVCVCNGRHLHAGRVAFPGRSFSATHSEVFRTHRDAPTTSAKRIRIVVRPISTLPLARENSGLRDVGKTGVTEPQCLRPTGSRGARLAKLDCAGY